MTTKAEFVAEVRSRMTPESLARVQARLDARQPVLLCCKNVPGGGEVCVAIDSHAECPASSFTKDCDEGISNDDGTATCFDDSKDEPGGTGG